jgi:cell division protein FtsL
MTKKNTLRKPTAPTGPSRENTRLRRLASVVISVTAVLFITTLVTANSLATRGGDSSHMTQKINELQSQNNELSAQLASLTSISRIYSQAVALGFVTPSKIENVSKTNPVALKQ